MLRSVIKFSYVVLLGIVSGVVLVACGGGGEDGSTNTGGGSTEASTPQAGTSSSSTVAMNPQTNMSEGGGEGEGEGEGEGGGEGAGLCKFAYEVLQNLTPGESDPEKRQVCP